MSRKAQLLFCSLLFILVYLVMYRAFFTNSPLVWGDAPFFYQENLQELYNKPLLWNDRNDNFGSSQAQTAWLYLPTFLFGLLNHLLDLSNALLIRLIFYFPATLLAILGSWLFLRRFTNSLWAICLGSLLYSFNTYFLMEVDGGPVGLALAYGLFPVVAWALFNYLPTFTGKSFLIAGALFFIITNVDLRVAVICLLFSLLWVVWQKAGKKPLINLVILGLVIIGLNSFWVLPFIHNGLSGSLSESSLAGNNNFISFLDSLLLFNPHFPLNDFGNLARIPFYFILFPFSLLSGLFLIKQGNKSLLKIYSGWIMMFLFWAFLTKGASDPIGGIYALAVQKIPFGVAFRDSSKFFIPLLLSSAVLLTMLVDNLGKKIPKKYFSLVVTLVFAYLLILIHPALLDGLSGTLSLKEKNNDFQIIADVINRDPDFARSLWFNEKPPLGYGSWRKPALSANSLYKERPFASMIDGKYDFFQFLQSPQFPEWLELLHVKYLLFPGNVRKKVWTGQQIVDNELFLQSLSRIKGVSKLDWPTTSFPIYRTGSSKPRIFFQKDLWLVLGGEDIYRDLIDFPNFHLSNQGIVFLEDGKTNLNNLPKNSLGSTSLVLVNKSNEDLAAVFLKDKMISPLKADYSQWGQAKSEDYLNWKYELLKGDIRTYDFDFGQGIAYSSVKGEKIKFDLKTPNSGEYVLALRLVSATSSAGLKVSGLGEEQLIHSDNDHSFNWYYFDPKQVSSSDVGLVLENNGGFVGLNTVFLVSKNDWDLAQQKANSLLENSKVYRISQKSGWSDLLKDNPGKTGQINFKQINPTLYQLELGSGGYWLTFSDHYNPEWKIGDEVKPLPFYAMVNGFWISERVPANLTLEYQPQRSIDNGIIITGITLAGLSVVFLTVLIKKQYYHTKI